MDDWTVRAKQLEWCKARARQYLNQGDAQQAVASFGSDIRKHPSTADIANHPMFAMMYLLSLRSLDDARSFIEGWN